MLRTVAAATVIVVSLTGTANAQGRYAVSRMPSRYGCVMLNFPPGFLYEHPETKVDVYASPSKSARVIGPAIGVMVARWPQEPENGFLEVVRTQSQRGWIEAKYLRVWSSPYAPNGRCEPSIMSDGTIGTRIVN